MAIHCVLLTKNNRIIIQNFLSEFKDKYDCMQTFDMVRSMVSAWQSANFKDGEEPTMPTKDEIEQFIQSQLGENKSKTNAISRVTKIISGGQTGVDTIGLQVAKKVGIETGGTAPKGFLREKEKVTLIQEELNLMLEILMELYIFLLMQIVLVELLQKEVLENGINHFCLILQQNNLENG